jgi:hypothetical protein
MIKCQQVCGNCTELFGHVNVDLLYQGQSSIEGFGLFTKVAIAPNRMIVPFTGMVGKPKSAGANVSDMLYLDVQKWITPKGVHRNVNHSCNPNATFIKWIRGEKDVVSIVALKRVAKHAEITVNYGAHHDFSTGHQLCNCGDANCVTIVKHKQG